jgi:hypothetical protein
VAVQFLTPQWGGYGARSGCITCYSRHYFFGSDTSIPRIEPTREYFFPIFGFLKDKFYENDWPGTPPGDGDFSLIINSQGTDILVKTRMIINGKNGIIERNNHIWSVEPVGGEFSVSCLWGC